QRLAAVFEEELGDIAKAESTYRRVLAVVPTDLVALENLDRIYTAEEQWAELAQVLEVRAKAVEDTFEKVELYLRLGHTYEERLAPAGGPRVSARALVTSADSMIDDLADVEEEEEKIEPSLDDLFPVGDS